MATIKTLTKHCLVATAYYTGLLTLLKKILNSAPSEQPLMLMYHRVLNGNKATNEYAQTGLSVSTTAFEKQIQFLSRHYRPMFLKDYVEHLIEGRPLKEKTVIVTFDDGWRDNYTCAYPILKKYSMPATIFLTTDFINTNKLFWFVEAEILYRECDLTPEQLDDILKANIPDNEFEKLKDSAIIQQSEYSLPSLNHFMNFLKKFDFGIIESILHDIRELSKINVVEKMGERWMLDWEEARAMDPEIIDFGSHGCSHRTFIRITPEEVRRELIESKKILEQKTSQEITLLAYPNGDFNDEIITIAKETGYRAAITTSYNENSIKGHNRYALNRTGVHEGMSRGVSGKFSKSIFYFEISGFRNILKLEF